MRCWIPLLITLFACAYLPARANVDCGSPSANRARVADVYPSAEELPANLLRLYVYFTHPMERTDPGAHVSLRDAQGQVIDGALLATRFGLWSSDGRRLTVLLDPGRVKTGLKAHERLGPVLQRGRGYSLHVARELRDQHGCSMAAGHSKPFQAGPEDRTPPHPGDWSLALPSVRTREALTVALHGLTDHLSLAYQIRVLDVEGRSVPGAIELADHEQVWRFLPVQRWSAGAYTIRVDPTLEDLAGNRPTGLFDDPTSANRERSERELAFDRVFILSE